MPPPATTPEQAWSALYGEIGQLGSGVQQAIDNISARLDERYGAMLYDMAGAAFDVHRQLWEQLIALNRLIDQRSSQISSALNATVQRLYLDMQQSHDSFYSQIQAQIDALARGIR